MPDPSGPMNSDRVSESSAMHQLHLLDDEPEGENAHNVRAALSSYAECCEVVGALYSQAVASEGEPLRLPRRLRCVSRAASA